MPRVSAAVALERPLAIIARAPTVSSLERAFQATCRSHPYRPFTLGDRLIAAAMRARGSALVAADPVGFYVPQIGERRRLQLCGETYRVGSGQNGPGERYVWTYAEHWANGLLHEHGAPREVRKAIWSWCGSYPHRALAAARRWRADPDRKPERVEREQYLKFHESVRLRGVDDPHDQRAMRPCPGCGGDQMDWGCAGIDCIEPSYWLEWRCMSCNRVDGEEMTTERLYQLRAKPSPRIGY
jgi:hypothetical protein